MDHLREEELILYYYREGEGASRIEDHLGACSSCRASYQELLDSLSVLDELVVPARGEDYGTRVWQRLRARQVAETRAHRRFFAWPGPLWAQTGWVAALVLAGFLLGRYLPGPERAELHAMRELLTLSLLQQQSASDRLAGVSSSRNFRRPDPKILDALVDALNHDPDMNVRLAAVDALSRFSGEADVRNQLMDALTRQSSPLVQITLIDLLVEMGEKRSAEILRRLAKDDKVNEYVRQRAEWALRQMS
jgi:hypothetical protein